MNREGKRQTQNRDGLWFLRQEHFASYGLTWEVQGPHCPEMVRKHVPCLQASAFGSCQQTGQESYEGTSLT